MREAGPRISGLHSRFSAAVVRRALERRFPGQRADDRSDHANFRRRGIPAIAFFTGWHDDYHETSDDSDKVNYDSLGRIAAAVRDVTVEIANAAGRRR
jgi:Zn-dependent M28 family amino/carboxypeptidase